ncbi:acyl carrier protein [Streptomyces sp. ISL-66]|uniref:acyl carrier protein n=1 Tax=Streptomyces sp. ISL-66 TaxID=2819186 RepID=UPI001BEC515B|nr:acyl carrier protein [Streptomyces sp. ISL-66]MBT2472567.1 acyl carrier protein [Streptomyces sp. ISL-66]
MSGPALAPGREEVIALLAQHDECPPEAVGERIDSLQLAWLVHVVEERYGIRLDLDEDLEAMDTVDGAVTVLGNALAAAPAPDRSAS